VREERDGEGDGEGDDDEGAQVLHDFLLRTLTLAPEAYFNAPAGTTRAAREGLRHGCATSAKLQDRARHLRWDQ
jgi:hypothetical protein